MVGTIPFHPGAVVTEQHPTPSAPQTPATAPALNPPRWRGRKTAVAAALAIGLGSAGAVAAAATVEQGSAGREGGASGFGQGAPGGVPWQNQQNQQAPGGQGPQGRPGSDPAP